MTIMDNPNDKLSGRLRARARGLSPTLVRVLEFIDTHRHEAMTKSALELAAEIGTSDATVIRAVQAAGYDGLRELREALATASGTGRTPIDTITRTFAEIKERSATVVDQVFSDHKEAFAALESEETRARIFAAIECLAPASRIGVFGGGATAFLGRYLALSLSQIGRPTAVFDGYMAPLPEQLLEMRNVDAVLMLAFGGPYKEAISAVAEARRHKVPVVLITDAKGQSLARHAAVVIPVMCSQAGRIIIHGATLVCLEAIIMGIVAHDPSRTLSTLERLRELRSSIHK
jgi:DNA-binding MurR/RpiR family transcriptional regulator